MGKETESRVAIRVSDSRLARDAEDAGIKVGEHSRRERKGGDFHKWGSKSSDVER